MVAVYSILLLLAIAFEIAGTTALKASAGFSKLTPTVVMVVCYLLCFALLGLSLKGLEVSVAYAIWSGLGTAAIAVIGFVLFNEQASPMKLVCIVLIVVGVVGLNLSGGGHAPDSPAAASTPAADSDSSASKTDHSAAAADSDLPTAASTSTFTPIADSSASPQSGA